MSSAYVFYSSLKTVKIPVGSDSPYKSIIALPNYNVFFGFPNGNWVLFDANAEKVVKDGALKGDYSKHLTLFRTPKAVDEKTILFANAADFKLQALNPITGEYDAGWQFDVPTLEGLPEEHRKNDTKVDVAFCHLEIHVLKSTKIVGVLERKENAQGVLDFLISAFQHGKKERLLQVSLANQNKSMRFAPANDKDTFVLFPETQFDTFTYYILNVNNAGEGLKQVTVNTKMDCTLSYLFPWKGENTVVFFGNPDEGGTPYQVTHKLGSDSCDIVKMNCHIKEPFTILDNVMAADPEKGSVLLKDNNYKGNSVTVWNSTLNRVEFSREQPNRVNAISATDGSYFIEFQGSYEPEKNESIQFSFNRLVSKKMFLLHFLKQAKFQNKPLIDIHGKIDVLRDVASMY
mmetsp:Transcript_34699/g.40575  ORF Transcript_34699/g.40575 Transcript_34699/m.40575 type:complete len:403 (+) Transcript_34699:43-1251(+)